MSVTVTYQEGKFERELLVTQYVTTPQQGQLDPAVAGTGGGSGAGLPGMLGGSTTGSSPLGGLLPSLTVRVPDERERAAPKQRPRLTLVELLVAIVVLSLISVLIYNAFASMKRSRRASSASTTVTARAAWR